MRTRFLALYVAEESRVCRFVIRIVGPDLAA